MPPTLDAPGWLACFLASVSQHSGSGLNEEFWRWRLKSGKAIALLDGLDEVPTEKDRNALVRWLERFAATYKDVQIVVTSRPAALLALPTGRLSPGAPADLLLFDPDRPWRVDEARFRSKCKNSPFDGRPVQGVVLRTVVDGRTVYQAET